jgi:CTP:molybdopterin cytidylyltransferase MocA
MKQVILIHAHKDIEQLNMLIDQLCDADFIIYVHLDRKSRIDPGGVHRAAHLVKRRIDVRWGGFSQVEATLNSVREILAAVPAFDKVVFLSAQDFPLLPNARLKEELARVAGRELIDTIPIASDGRPVAFRHEYFHPERGGWLERGAWALVNRLMRLLKVRRRLPAGLSPYGGSSWWALSRPCLMEVFDRIERDPAILRFFRTVLCPDEMFFQTLVMNSPFRGRVLPQNFRYILWPERNASHPKVLDESDFDDIRDSEAHFCRKLDIRISAGLLSRLIELKQSRAVDLRQ